ncbi:MAG: hypothetical protein DI585_00560 [Pseudomonas fluorescens]|nr:MAG: hypothetical protein DI585_00560 [Pseudomonas fluorescens]
MVNKDDPDSVTEVYAPDKTATDLPFGTGTFEVKTTYLPIPKGLTVKEYQDLFGSNLVKVCTVINGTMTLETEAKFHSVKQGKAIFIPWGSVGNARRSAEFSHYARKHTVCVKLVPAQPA